MTYDERQEIEEYLVIIKKNCDRVIRSIDMMQMALGKIECKKKEENAKEEFLRNY
jgi:hypothetical protein